MRVTILATRENDESILFNGDFLSWKAVSVILGLLLKEGYKIEVEDITNTKIKAD